MTAMSATVFAAAALMCGVTAAQAQTQGILTCQIDLSQFAQDVYQSKARLTPTQLSAARKLVEVGRSQCRSGPDLVNVNIRSMRQSLALSTGQPSAIGFSEFWPASPEELSLLQ